MQVHGLSDDGETIVLRRFGDGMAAFRKSEGPVTKRILLVDVETTGLHHDEHRVIEFAATLIGCNDQNEFVTVEDVCDEFEDPGEPLTDEIVKLTGITDEQVRDQKFSDKPKALMESADLIISHNAEFDWNFVNLRWPDLLDHKLWGCSLTQIDWSSFPSAKQEVLTRYHGFFYDAHRAIGDVRALSRLLTMRQRPDAPSYFQECFTNAHKTVYRVKAIRSPFSEKEALKQRHYRWDNANKVWWRFVYEQDLAAERALLRDMYRRCRQADTHVAEKCNPYTRWLKIKEE